MVPPAQGLTPYNAELCLYKPWRPKVFCSIIITVLVSSFCFIWIPIKGLQLDIPTINYWSAKSKQTILMAYHMCVNVKHYFRIDQGSPRPQRIWLVNFIFLPWLKNIIQRYVCVHCRRQFLYLGEIMFTLINPLDPHDALKHNFASLKNVLIS